MAQGTEAGEAITGTISIEVGGRAYTGGYTVRDGWMTIITEYGSKSAAVHEAPPGKPDLVGIASLLMHEIIGAAIRKGQAPRA